MMNSVGPHDFKPLTWREKLHLTAVYSGRCLHCYQSESMHPVTGWVDARPMGDKSPVSDPDQNPNA